MSATVPVIYAGVTPQYWLPAARALRRRLGWEPTWWLATEPAADRGSYRAAVRSAFPGVVWHDAGAAMRGRFPLAIEAWPAVELDGATVERLAPYEVVALRMMDRQDPDTASFPYALRRRHWLELVRGWQRVLGHLRPGAVVFGVGPHLVADYALYACATDRGIRTIVCDSDWRHRRILVADDLGGGASALRSAAPAPGEVGPLSPEAAAALQRLRGDYEEAAPALDQVQRARAPRPPAVVRVGRVAVKAARRATGTVRTRHDPDAPIASGARQWLVVPGRPPERSLPTVARMWRYRMVGRRRSAALSARWASLVSVGRPPAAPYVYVPLHFQPERTTCPSGGPYVDQLLMVRLLASSLPDGWLVVVREHPATFLPKGVGHRGRVPAFYDDLAAVPGVELAPVTGDPLPWLDGAAIVATVTGTSAWEAVARGRRAMVFGYPWYRGAPGVVEVRTAADVVGALAGVDEPVDQAALERWVARLDEVSTEGFVEPTAFAASGWTAGRNGEAIAEAIVRHVERSAAPARVVAVVQARMGSTRLPGKVLHDIGGRPMLDRVLRRLAAAERVDEVMVATSTLDQDDAIVERCRKLGVRVVRGDALDVLSRYITALDSVDADVVVRVTADCPFIDPVVVDEVVERLLAGDADYSTNCLDPRTFPRGLDVEAFRASALRQADALDTDPASREHVTPFLRTSGRFRVVGVQAPESAGSVRWTVDTVDDLAAARALAERAGGGLTTSWLDLLAVWRHAPDIQAINAHVEQKPG